jgi:hypothetical protein
MARERKRGKRREIERERKHYARTEGRGEKEWEKKGKQREIERKTDVGRQKKRRSEKGKEGEREREEEEVIKLKEMVRERRKED